VRLRFERLVRGSAVGSVLLALLTGCGSGSGSATGAPDVRVVVGGQALTLHPTQYCLAGTGQRYDIRPPVIGVTPDTTLDFIVPGDVAAQGWSVQVFDQQLEEKLGEVSVDEGQTTLAGIAAADVVPSNFYLVVVENRGSACGGFSGAWPVGFIRSDAPGAASGTATMPPAG
jgi:hypothetical protein